MAEFVDINNTVSCNDDCVISVEIPKAEIKEDPLCVKECDTSVYYGCPTEDGSFKVKNLFSELTSDYQRHLAKINLGINDEAFNEWGNIKGNLFNQKDLMEYLYENINSKADLDSPLFTGKPKVPNPLFDDYSQQIPTTKWVADLLNSYNGYFGLLNSFVCDPSFAYIGDPEKTITLRWSYKGDISKQKINGTNLDVNTRELNVTVSTSSYFTLVFEYDGVVEARTISFIYKTPNYIGTSNDYTELSKTVYNKFDIDCGNDKYAYILLSNNIDAKISVNGIIGGFIKLHNIFIGNTQYYVYRSFNKGLGLINIVIE